MANLTVQARISPELKRDAEAVFAAMGMTVAEGIRVFLQQSVNIGGLPFQPSAKRPNAETLAAMDELNAGDGKRFNSVDDLFNEAQWLHALSRNAAFDFLHDEGEDIYSLADGEPFRDEV